MRKPTVSFVVPCYKLAHFLLECVNSILSQSFTDFEVLIMDDCSPDNTAEVAQSLQDHRVKHICNDSNLGHLLNYNKGINLARGKYVWLISADDRFRSHLALERYVRLMEDHPEVGYVFCPGVGLKDGVETILLSTYYYGKVDKILDGRQFISTVLGKGGGLVSPSVMVRKDCYDKISMFPLDMPHQGDMYLWFLWALENDVAYMSEPMVNYRSHDLNMMKDLLTRVPMTTFTDEVNVLWRIKRKSEQMAFGELAQLIEFFIAQKYADAAAFATYGETSSPCGIEITQCEEALRANTVNESEFIRLRGKFYALMADKHWRHGYFQKAYQSMANAGEYSYFLNVVIEMLRSSDLTNVERRRVANFRLLAAGQYWCQRRYTLSFITVGHAILICPIILGLPIKRLLKPFLRWGYDSSEEKRETNLIHTNNLID